MFELELHDVIPYLFSISLLYTLAYAYASHLKDGGFERWEYSQVETVQLLILPQSLVRVVPIRHWLVRKVKRKESPDDDSSVDCSASLVNATSNLRGGFQCQRTMYSLHPDITVSS